MADAMLRAHIAKLRAELRALEAPGPSAPRTRRRSEVSSSITWRGHAIQLRRLSPHGHRRMVFQGSMTQCLQWARQQRVKTGRIWIEDIAEPSVQHQRCGPKKRRAA